MDHQKPEALLDYQLVGTPLRGLIIRGPFSLCAYIGVPKDHWMANMPELQFPCHWGVTFSGEGDGEIRPKGFWWYGWDYGHAGDFLELPEEVLKSAPAELLEIFDRLRSIPLFDRPAKKWTLAEVEQDLLDAAISLSETMHMAHDVTISIAPVKNQI